MSKFKNVKADLKAILENREPARDNNISLYNIYLTEKMNVPLDAQYIDVMFGIYSGKYPTMDTVSRLSRQIQQQNPHLRGKNWEKRHGQQREVKKDLGYNAKN